MIITTLGSDAVGNRVDAAVEAIRAGRPVVVTDGPDRQDEADLVIAAVHTTPELMAFVVRYTSGFISVAMTEADCLRLDLPAIPHRNGNLFGTAFRVTVDLPGPGTGISAADRASTVAALADPTSGPEDLVRPGHVVPVAARDGGVLQRAGHTEAAVDLARSAGLHPAAILAGIVSAERPGEMARGAELDRFVASHGFVRVSVADLVAHRERHEPQVHRVVTTSLPTRHGRFVVHGYRGRDGEEHVALVAGGLDGGTPVPVHVHTECMSGDVVGSLSCRCGAALDEAMTSFAAQGRGVVVYVRPAGPVQACTGRGDVQPGVSLPWMRSPARWILADLGLPTEVSAPAADQAASGPAVCRSA